MEESDLPGCLVELMEIPRHGPALFLLSKCHKTELLGDLHLHEGDLETHRGYQLGDTQNGWVPAFAPQGVAALPPAPQIALPSPGPLRGPRRRRSKPPGGGGTTPPLGPQGQGSDLPLQGSSPGAPEPAVRFPGTAHPRRWCLPLETALGLWRLMWFRRP